MEHVRAAWAEALMTAENEETKVLNAGESREAAGMKVTEATQCKTSTERAMEAATTAMIFLQRMTNSAMRQKAETPEDRRNDPGRLPRNWPFCKRRRWREASQQRQLRERIGGRRHPPEDSGSGWKQFRSRRENTAVRRRSRILHGSYGRHQAA